MFRPLLTEKSLTKTTAKFAPTSKRKFTRPVATGLLSLVTCWAPLSNACENGHFPFAFEKSLIHSHTSVHKSAGESDSLASKNLASQNLGSQNLASHNLGKHNLGKHNLGEQNVDKPTFASYRTVASKQTPTNTALLNKPFPKEPATYYLRNQQIRQLVIAGQCKTAMPLIEQSLAEYQDDGDMWRTKAECAEQLGDYELAISHFKKAIKLGTTPWDAEVSSNAHANDMMISIARLFAKLGNEDLTMKWLKRGLEARYDERPDLINVPEFTSLKSNPEFMRLLGYAPANAEASSNLTRLQKWQQDISYFREQIAVLHANPDFKTQAEVLERKLSTLMNQLEQLSDERITAKLVEFVGDLGAGHDIFWPVNGNFGTLKPFAIKFYLFSDGLFIIDAYDKSLVGAKVMQFNQTPVEQAFAKIVAAFPGDNMMNAMWQSARHFAQPYTLENLGIIDDAEAASITLIDKNGEQRTIQPERRAFTPFTPALTDTASNVLNVSDLSLADANPRYIKNMRKFYWMEELTDLNALYVQLNLVQNAQEQSLQAFANDISDKIDQANIHHLILDLRHSPGGNGYLTPALLRQLVRFDATPNKGELYVLIGRNTFSASQNLITDLDWIANPIFVGEPSGSKPNAYSESGQLRLPNSGFSLMISSQFHQHSWPEDQRQWITPDIPVSLSSHDFFTGQDPAMAAIEKLISQPKQLAKGAF